MAKEPKLAIVHNWLTVRGGSEKIIFLLHKRYPHAPIYTLVFDRDNFPELADADVRTTWLQKVPGLRSKHELFPPLRYMIWRFKKLKGFDVVLSISSSENKAIRVSEDTKHISYINNPPHYYWRYHEEFLKNPGFGSFDPLARVMLKILNPMLKYFDKKAAQNPDILLANSNFIKDQIKLYYGRSSVVVHPPVDIDRFSKNEETPSRKDYFLVFGRQVVFKKMDLVVKAFKSLPYDLLVIGDGPEHDSLVSLAKKSKNITFKTNVNDKLLAKLIRSARACVFANEEDFGITWVESVAAGTPVVTYGSGGALDTIKEGVNGIFFKKQSLESIRQAVEKCVNTNFDTKKVKESARPFRSEVFEQKIDKLIRREAS